ncbi:MAG: hypothetical protein SynsKO_14980 [Synoicihabitans sp.]
MKIRLIALLSGMLLTTVGCLATEEDPSAVLFKELDQGPWQEAMYDSGKVDWTHQWVLDGREADITNDADGMHYASGWEEGNHAHHAVLWTKQSFAGDVRIDFSYTRTDDAIRNVNIIYVQATGNGEGEFVEDIVSWSHLRAEPWMKYYFQRMNTYHISFAAFGTKNTDPAEDYIRARRYMPGVDAGLRGTDLKPDYARTGLFNPGETYQVTVIKRGRDLLMRIVGQDGPYFCHWRNEDLPPIQHGRIGLRHMYARSARYQDFRVAVRPGK